MLIVFLSRRGCGMLLLNSEASESVFAAAMTNGYSGASPQRSTGTPGSSKDLPRVRRTRSPAREKPASEQPSLLPPTTN